VRGAEAAATAGSDVPAISAPDLKALLDRNPSTFLLDVRNPEEITICRIPGSTVIPLPDLPSRLSELDPATPMIVHCKSGARSLKAIALLRDAGFQRLTNLSGGILAWIREVDPSLPTY
jgi:sulfur-carrier protein adenylyltransferase/sulfurtransferase